MSSSKKVKNLSKYVCAGALALNLAFAPACGGGSAGSDSGKSQTQEDYDPLELPPPPEDPIKNLNMHEGINLTSWWYNDYLNSNIGNTLDKLCSLGVESISLLTTWYQETPTSTEIYSDATKTPLDSGLEDVIADVKSRGLRTVLKPHVDPLSGWRGQISFDNEADWAAWFENYNNFIMHYAEIAEANGVDVLVIGTELSGTEQRPEWNDIIDNVRDVYSGEIVYGANWDSYQDVPFWEKVDYIGVDAYFPLTSSFDPTPEQLETAVQGVAQELKDFSELNGKQIMITEVGYQSYDGSNITPWEASTRDVDEQEQADCYNAMLEAFFNQDWCAGIYFWDTHWDMRDLDGFGFIGKTAEQEVNDFYHKMD